MELDKYDSNFGFQCKAQTGQLKNEPIIAEN